MQQAVVQPPGKAIDDKSGPYLAHAPRILVMRPCLGHARVRQDVRLMDRNDCLITPDFESRMTTPSRGGAI
jgi:hypothetical protein